MPESIEAIKAGRLLATAEFNGYKMGCLATMAAVRSLRKETVPDTIVITGIVIRQDHRPDRSRSRRKTHLPEMGGLREIVTMRSARIANGSRALGFARRGRWRAMTAPASRSASQRCIRGRIRSATCRMRRPFVSPGRPTLFSSRARPRRRSTTGDPHVADEHRHPIDIESQTRRAMEGIKLVLDDQGLSWRHVVKVTKYLTDMRDMDGMVEVLAEYFGDWKPASTTICNQRAVHARCAGRARHDRRAPAGLTHAAARDPRRSRRRRPEQPASPVPLLALRNVSKTFPACARSTT